MTQPDLFDIGSRQPQPRGPTSTAAPIGSGPAGERCGTCRHAAATGAKSGRRYYKCDLVRHLWTHGAGSDIKLRWAACREWAAGKPHRS